MSGSTHHDDFHRREPRYKLISGADARVLVQPQGSPEPLDAQLIDMSNSGLQLRVQTCLKFDESMAVHILAGELQFDLAASVKWIRQGDGQNWFVGCHIKPELSEDALIQLATIGLLDRRVSSRREVKLTGSICGELEGSKATAMVRNLSEDGFGLATPVARVVGQRVRVAVHRPNGEAIDVTARVIWQIKTHDGYFCGCAFLNRQHQSELSALADSKDKGLFERGGGPGRSKRRTSMWVALAALVVFVFPSAIVLLMDGHSRPQVETASNVDPTSAPREADKAPMPSVSEQPDQSFRVKTEPTQEIIWHTGPALVEAGPDELPVGDRLANDPVEAAPVPGAELIVIEDAADSADMAREDGLPEDTHMVFKATEPDIAEVTASVPGESASSADIVKVTPPQYVVSGENWLTRYFGNEFGLDRAVALAQSSSSHVNDDAVAASTPPPPAAISTIAKLEPDTTADVAEVPTTGYRVWTDSSGNYRVVAKLVSVQNGVAKLLKENGRYTSVPIERLSKEDAAMAERWAVTGE
jgi:hypothetical protein